MSATQTLVASSKSALNKHNTLSDSADPFSCTPLYGLFPPDAEFVLQPLVMALESGSVKVIEPAFDCVFRLFSFGLIRCEIDQLDGNDKPSVLYRIIECVCKCGAFGEEGIKLTSLEVLLCAVRSSCVLIRGDCLVQVVRSCYNVYLGGLNGTNQICAKLVLAHMMIIVFTRMEQDNMVVSFRTVSVAELLEFTDRNLNEGSSIQFVQNFINEVVEVNERVC